MPEYRFTYPTPLKDSFRQYGEQRARESFQQKEWVPIKYTSLRGWMFMNYSFIVLIVALIALILYGVWHD